MNDIQLRGILFVYQKSKKENWENKNKNLFGYHKKRKKMVNIKKNKINKEKVKLVIYIKC